MQTDKNKAFNEWDAKDDDLVQQLKHHLSDILYETSEDTKRIIRIIGEECKFVLIPTRRGYIWITLKRAMQTEILNKFYQSKKWRNWRFRLWKKLEEKFLNKIEEVYGTYS